MEDTLLAGKWEISIGNVLLPARMLGDISPNYEEGIVEASTQAGVRKQPSGKAETAELMFSMFLSNLDELKTIFEVAEADPLILGAGNCTTQNARPINIHQVCDGNDGKNDIHVYAGLISTKFNPTLSTSDAFTVELTVQMQPTDEGYLLLGYPDPATPSYWDVETQAWVEIPVAP